MTNTKATRANTTPGVIIPAIPKEHVLGRLAALSDASMPELKDQWRALFGAEPPPYSRKFLESRLSYRVQELAYGALKPETIKRLETLGEQIDGKNITLRRIRQEQRPITDTRLLREWQGVEHVVTVQRDGFEGRGGPISRCLRSRAPSPEHAGMVGRFSDFALEVTHDAPPSRCRRHTGHCAQTLLRRLHPRQHGRTDQPGIQLVARPARCVGGIRLIAARRGLGAGARPL